MPPVLFVQVPRAASKTLVRSTMHGRDMGMEAHMGSDPDEFDDELDELLDEAEEESFPASDPPATGDFER